MHTHIMRIDRDTFIEVRRQRNSILVEKKTFQVDVGDIINCIHGSTVISVEVTNVLRLTTFDFVQFKKITKP